MKNDPKNKPGSPLPPTAEPPLPQKKPTNYPIITFLARYWMLIILNGLTIWATTSEEMFKVVGPLLFIPAATVTGWVMTLLLRHLFFRETMDAEVHDGSYLKMWFSLTPEERIKWHIVVLCSIFIGVSIITAAVAK